jgi:hypothetical protein
MRRRSRRFSLELVDPQLERRELLSLPAALHPAATIRSSQAGGKDLFHQNGVNGLVLHRAFVNRLNDRLTASKDQATRVIQAFQVFATSYKALPVNPPPGANGPTLESLVATLKQEMAIALIRREGLSSQATVSEMRSIRFSPLAPVALVPFAASQIDTMATTLAKLPPVTGPNGTLTTGDPTPAINVAVNAILNAIAESSIHPLLFLHPGNFYLNPNAQFTLASSGVVPAQTAPGFFIRGPHGVILPGATLHPHAPN